MADRNLVLQLLITAKDEASAAFGKIFSYLDNSTRVVATKIREAFTNLFGGGLDGAMEFEAQMDRVIAKGDETYQSFSDLGGQIRQVGAQFGISGTEAAQDMEALAAAGLSASDAIGTLPSVLALAASEQISADAAAQKLIDSLSIMGLGFDEAGRMADVLAKGVTSGKDALGTYNKALLDGAVATATAQDKTALLTAEIARVSEASAAWRQGKELNIVILNSLQNTLESTQAKLALLEERQRAGEQVDNEIIKTKAAVQEAYNRYNQALEANVIQQERAVEAAQRANQLGQQEADLNVQRAQSALELAQIKDDSNAVSQAENELLDAQVAKIQAAVAGKDQEIAAYDALIEATRRKLAADGELDVSDQNQLAVMADKRLALELEQRALQDAIIATQDKAKAERDAAAAAQAAAAAAKAAADAAAEAADKQKSLGNAVSTALSAANRALRDLDGDTEKLTARFNDLQSSMLSTVNAQGMAGWMGQIAAVTQALTQEFESQKTRLTDLTATLDRFAETGAYTTSVQQAMIQSAGDLDQQYTLLNQQDLDNLRAALDSANQKLKAMQQETEDARVRLAELNAELLEAQGADQKAELLRQQLSFQQQLAEIEKQRAEAEAAGNRELLTILADQEATLRRINDTKIKNIEADTASETTGDKLARTWRGAADAVNATDAALTKLSTADLTRLHTQMTGIAEQAGKLRDAL